MQKFIIIGAGILGASTAYHLTKEGADVTIVDRQDPGQATSAAAGIICPWLSQRRNKAWYQLVKAGARYYPELIKELESQGETNTGYKRVGAISLHSDQKKLDQLEERALKRREDSPEIGEVIRLSPAATKDLFPPLSDRFGSVWVSGAARVDGRALRNSLLRGAQKNGARLLHADASLLFENHRVVGVRLDNTKLEADLVIDTTGAWSYELLSPLGMGFEVKPQKAQIIHLQLLKTDTSHWPVVIPPNNQYLLAFEEGRIVIGATHEDEAGFDQRVTAGGMHEILDKALMIAPGLSTSSVLETRVGFRPYTPNFLPVIGPLPHFHGILLANGLGASGLTSGPYLGMQLAKLALGRPLEIDLGLYDVANAINGKE